MKSGFVVQVSGKRYQSFLIDYIFFAWRAYSNSTVIVLYDRSFSKKTKDGLKYLEGIGCKFVLIKTDFKKLFFKKTTLFKNYLYTRNISFRQCGRFLINHPVFHEFDELYIGDIDILISREEENLFKQHRIHSELLKMPYSDIVRKSRKKSNKGFVYSIKCFLKYGLIFFKQKRKYKNDIIIHEMTGLRYIKVDEYFKKVNNNLYKYINLIGGLFDDDDLYQKYTISTFSDQQILYSLMMSSFGSVPEESNDDGIDSSNPMSICYRPHHGIHLKMFYSKSILKLNLNNLETKNYKHYLKDFVEVYYSSEYVELSKYRFGKCKNQINRMVKYLKSKSFL